MGEASVAGSDVSPSSVVERLTGGGLRRGQLGVVAAPAGAGKSTLLTALALAGVSARRRVLHVDLGRSVDSVRASYEAALDAAAISGVRAEAGVFEARLLDEWRRIVSLPPVAGVAHVEHAVRFAAESGFAPELVVVDAGPTRLTAPDLRAVATIAPTWAAVRAESSRAAVADAGENAVVLWLASEGDDATLEVAAGPVEQVRMGARARVPWWSAPPPSQRSADRALEGSRPRLVSGGSAGAEEAFGECAERWGLDEVNYSFEGHAALARVRGLVVLSEAELARGDVSLVYASRRLGRVLTQIPMARSLLQAIWHQVRAAEEVFVVGAVLSDLTVRGGTGWGAELAKLWRKPLAVFDQPSGAWLRWGGSGFVPSSEPRITKRVFAGLGTLTLEPGGRAAVEALFHRSFGEPV